MAIGKAGRGTGHLGGVLGTATGLRQVATRGYFADTLTAFTGTANAQTYHYARDDITSLQVGWPGFYVDSSGVEHANTGVNTINAAVWYNGTAYRLKFGGAVTGTTPSNGFLISDPLSINIPSGAKFYIRSFSQFSVASLSRMLSTNTRDVANGDAVDFNAVDETMSGTITDFGGNVSMTWPALILGRSSKPAVLIVGDSRSIGDLGDSYSDGAGYVGNIERAVAPIFATLNTGRDSIPIESWLSRSYSLQALRYFSHVICEGGYADIIANNHRTAAQMQTILPNVYALFSGKRVYQATYEPYTTSTDSWATTANQTADATNGDRITMNTAIRGGLGGIAGYFDIASVAESALNSGKWKAPNWTSDGLHGNQNANANFSNSTIWTPFIGANLHFSTASGDKDSLVTISPNSQLATAQAGIGGNGAQVIAKPGTTTGKMYFAATIGSVAPAAGIGIGLSTDQFTTGVTYLGGNTASLCLYGNAAVVLNGVALATYFTLAANDVVELAVDIPNKLIWLRKNGGNWNNSGAANPATGAGGLSISSLVGTTINPAFSLQGTGESWTINKSLTPPSGFSYFG